MNETLTKLTANLFAKDPEIDFRIKADTERYRKGFGELELVDSNYRKIDRADVSFKLKKHEFKFGCNAFMFEEFDQAEQNRAYADKLKDVFNLAVLPFFWSDLEPKDGKLRFRKNSISIHRRPAPDLLVEYCKKNNITSKGHNLLWDKFYPEWPPRNPNHLIDRIERRFREIAEHYHDSIKIWDVVNEAFNWNPLTNQMPSNHIELAFKLAEKYFSAGTTLIYNDITEQSWGEYHGNYTPLNMLIRQHLEKGLKIDCLGLQYHMFYKDPKAMLENEVQNIYYSPKQLFAVMDQYMNLGIPFNVSEITIPGSNSFGGDVLQAEIAEKLYRIWFSHPNNSQIIWWNLVDGTAAYAPLGSDKGENYYKAGLLNYDFTHKPVYDVIKNLIHNEWSTNTTLKYMAKSVNKFHGFFGDYEVTVKTSQGEFKENLSMYKGIPNKFKLKLK